MRKFIGWIIVFMLCQRCYFTRAVEVGLKYGINLESIESLYRVTLRGQRDAARIDHFTYLEM